MVVLDKSRLNTSGQRKFDRIMEGPIASAVSKARKQLLSSRAELASINCNVLLLINDGYTALGHDALLRMTAHRVRQDTSNIDAVVVAGSYLHGDGFDTFSLWPMSCEQINSESIFHEFENLRMAWGGLAERFMSESVLGVPDDVLSKSIAMDLGFVLNETKFVMPTLRMGSKSDFFSHGRPREQSPNDAQESVGIVFPEIVNENWGQIMQELIPNDFPTSTCTNWNNEYRIAQLLEDSLRPIIPIKIQYGAWKYYCEREGQAASYNFIINFAMHRFNEEMKRLLENVSEYVESSISIPSCVNWHAKVSHLCG